MWYPVLQLESLGLCANSLSGPAFTPAWTRPGALGTLSSLDLAGNTQLTGTLPANLQWPKLQYL